MFHLLLSVIYLAFISLGLPDALLGSAWPSMYPAFHVPVSYAGIISMIIAAGTVISSLQSDRLTKKLGTGKITAISVATTAVALFGFSVSHSFIALCLWAVPYGLGGGSVDAALNNYVALHYESRHMSWLHCMWGVGASIGPYIMGYALSNKQEWSMGYRYISIFQIGLTAILIISLPLWKQFHKKEHVGQSASGSGNTLPVLTSSVTPQLSRHPLSGPAVTSYCTLDILPRKRPDLPVSSLLELLWAEASAASLRSS